MKAPAAFISSTSFPVSSSTVYRVSLQRPSGFSTYHLPARLPVVRHAQNSISMSSTSQSRRSQVLEGPFEGKFGTWYLTQGDADDVLAYRLCLLTMAISTASMTALALTQGRQIPSQVYDIAALVAAAGFGGALQKIHIYAKPLHKMLKLLWAIGTGSGLVLGLSPLIENGLVETIFDKPTLLLSVGWSLVALTGLFVKEAICFGRLEALLLIALVPALSGGHFIGALPASVEKQGAVLLSVLFVFFALRKFSQPASDDIGDMSVFDHLKKGGQL